MISPNEIMNKKFDKGMKGYKTEAVEKYLETVADEMSSLISENKDLETKMNILAEKLEEYKNDEDSLRVALLSAQRLGDSVIKEAKAKADAIVREATTKAERLAEATQRQIEREQFTLLKLQKEVGNFKNRLMAIYKQHIELINALPSDGVGVEDEKEETLEDIKDFAERIPNQTLDTAKNEPKVQAAKESDTIKFTIDNVPEKVEEKKPAQSAVAKELAKNAARGESRFGPLKFGEGYELKRDN